MIHYYIADLAKQMQIPLASVTVEDDGSAINRDSRRLKLSSGESTTFVSLMQTDLIEFHLSENRLLKLKIQTALERLLIQIES
jgi:hypothetical protein